MRRDKARGVIQPGHEKAWTDVISVYEYILYTCVKKTEPDLSSVQ